MKKVQKRRLFWICFTMVMLGAAMLRGLGLWHGMEQGIIFHPDSPKQVLRLENYLRGYYVHHSGNVFYDGYPYGLNRVDEGILRAARRTKATIDCWLSGQVNHPKVALPPPDHESVYAQGRLLRVLYGVLTGMLVFASARRWGAGRWAALAGAALYAASPLAVAVTHSVTGDIGVDLFVAAALYAASAQAVGGRALWWAAFGAACGAGWACKFQGALAAWMAVPPLLLGLRDGWRGWMRLAGAGLLAAAGFAGAALLLNPALALDTAREWQDTWRMFSFVQNYGIPAERLAWPLGKKVAWGLSHNMPLVAGCLGWCTVVLGLAASGILVAVAGRTAFARGGMQAEDTEDSGPADPTVPAPTPEELRMEAEVATRTSRWLLGITTFPWLAFLAATALKLEIQPFHFTFLIPPVALCMALAISWWTEPPDGEPRPMAAAAAILLAGLALAEALHGTAREIFFWRRPDTKDLARSQAEAVFGDRSWGMDRLGTNTCIKRYYAEPATIPCFRNPVTRLACPPGAWKEGQTLLPVPAVPMPAGPGDGWIFLDGPVFPRSDRMFVVPATGNGGRPPATAADGSPLFVNTIPSRGALTERILVFPSPPRNLVLGLRTGRLPVRCGISTSLFGPVTERMLDPESQTVLELPQPDPEYSYPEDGSADRPAVWACRLRVHAQIGPVWVTVLGSPEERALYEFHGPEAVPAPHPVAGDLPLFAAELGHIRYLDSSGPFPVPEASDPLLPPPVPGAGPGLAAGAYRFRARVASPGPATVSLLFSDRNPTDAPDTLPSASFQVPAGGSDIDWAFEKPYAPYGATLRAAADIPGVTLLSWTLKPDPGTLAAEGRIPPASAAPLLPGDLDPASVPATPIGAVYPRFGTLLDIRIPDSWHVSDTIPYAATVRLDPRIPHRTFGHAAIFLHLEDENGELARTLDYNLADASFEGGPVRWKLNAPGLAPGTYVLRAGFFDAYNHGRKFSYSSCPLPQTERKNRSVLVKTVTILPD